MPVSFANKNIEKFQLVSLVCDNVGGGESTLSYTIFMGVPGKILLFNHLISSLLIRLETARYCEKIIRC